MVVQVLNRVTVALTGLLLLSTVSGCDSSSGTMDSGLPDDAKVVYRFNDSSVPPQYHRSFELTVTTKEARLVVDSYGEILADEKTVEVDQAWQVITRTYSTLDALPVVKSELGCVGGTSRSLEITQGETSLKDISIEECGGVNDAAVSTMAGWVDPVLKLFPAIAVLAPS